MSPCCSHLLILSLLTFMTTQTQIVAQPPPGQSTEKPPVLSWQTLSDRMTWEADHGFSGVVLVVRDGAIAFHQAYGQSDRHQKIAMRPDTIFAIGSTPIDFTMAAVLKLVDMGKLQLSDPITKCLKEVPQDKQAITIQQLMTGRSGLPDFHDIPGDKDKDHSWIDRDEAIRRILNSKLLFTPGSRREHSHSAFGLLAAIIEIVSGQSYQDFTREHLFIPAGMNDTGFFGEKIDPDRLAIGYGVRKDGEINAPPYWGKTSWLVMGSGGQTSTALDMFKWTQALRNGKLLSPESLKHYPIAGNGMLDGGDMYGFDIRYAGNPRQFMLIISNSGNRQTRPRLRALGAELYALLFNVRPGKFTLGVQFQAEQNQPAKVVMVVPDGAAAQAGLQVGDLLLKAKGESLGDNPGPAFAKLLQSGDPFELEIQRQGKTMTMKIKPMPRQE